MIKQLFSIGRNLISQRKVAAQFKYYNLKQKFYFSQTNQSIDSLKNKLTELNNKYYELEEFDQKQKTMQDVIAVKMQLNQLLFPAKAEQNSYYEGFRRDQLVLAQLNFENDNKAECDRIIQQIMSGDYLNEFKDHKDENESFLSGLYIIHCMTNLDKLSLAEDSAAKALDHLYYFIENHCPIYQKCIKEEKPDSDSLFENELQYLQNTISHLMVYSKICQERGKLNDSIQQLGQAATLLDNIGHIFRKIFSKQIEIKTELKEDELKKFFMSVLVNEAITLKGLAKSCLKARRFSDSKNLLEAATTYFDYLIEQKLIYPHDEHYISVLLDKYDYVVFTGDNIEEKSQIKQKLDQIISQLKEEESTLPTFLRYEVFLYKYYDAGLEKLNKHMSQFQNDVPTQLEINQTTIQALLLKGNLQPAFEMCKKQLDILKQYFDSSHYMFGETLLHMIEISIVTKDFLQAKNCIVQLSSESHNLIYIQDFESILKLVTLRVEFLEKLQTNQLEQINKTLEKMESIAFTNFQDSYTKSAVLAKFYQAIGNKPFQKLKLEECLNILQSDENFVQKEILMAEIKENISKLQ